MPYGARVTDLTDDVTVTIHRGQPENEIAELIHDTSDRSPTGREALPGGGWCDCLCRQDVSSCPASVRCPESTFSSEILKRHTPLADLLTAGHANITPRNGVIEWST